ncbi:NodT family RND efflux system outer membrane lipoprotein [Flammeovirgaceae bacterium 311]|nr:NodT family RND efflux system outer membrane lipoprotein [Flammeovirgaceae bacterium 311]
MAVIPAGKIKHAKVIKRHAMAPPCYAPVTRPFYILLSFLLVFTAVFFSACTPRTSKTTLPLDPPEAFSDSGDAEMPANWWTTFEDQELNAMVSQALDSNFNLMTTWYRFQAARAVADRESSYLLPDIEGSLQVATNYPQPNFVGGENLRFGLAAFYEIDLWGRIGSRIAAERFRAEATLLDYQAAAISLSGEIARSWYGLVAARQQLALVEEQIETNEKILRLIRARFGSGQTRAVDFLRQKQLIESTREQKIFTESRIELLEHQLAVLLGVPPQREIGYLAGSFPELPPLPQTGIPAELVQRRPDVQSAFKLLQAADREVAAAISNKYPRFSISAAPSVRANNAEDLFQDWAYSLAANLAAPLFYGGRLSAEVDRTQAVKQQRLYEWGQTVLIAFREVEDALIQEQKQQESIAVLEEQLSLAEQAFEQLRLEYFNGISDYLAVLTALGQEQQLRRDLIAARLNLLEYRIALYRALAGGFNMAGVPED